MPVMHLQSVWVTSQPDYAQVSTIAITCTHIINTADRKNADLLSGVPHKIK